MIIIDSLHRFADVFFDSLRSLQTIQRVLVGAAKDLVCRSVAIWKK